MPRLAAAHQWSSLPYRNGFDEEFQFTTINTIAHDDFHQLSVMEEAAHEDKTEAAVAMSRAPRTPTTSNPPSSLDLWILPWTLF